MQQNGTVSAQHQPRISRLFPILLLSAFLLSALTGTSHAESCTLDGIGLAEGESHAFFLARSVPAGEKCSSIRKRRSCDGGELTGADKYRFQKCVTLENFMGVNVNRKPGDLDPALLERTGADWIRTNVDILIYEEQDRRGTESPNWRFSDWDVYKAAAAGEDRKAILNLMWDFGREGVSPPVPGSDRERELLAYLDTRILDELAEHVDILVTGNEPFVNTRPEDWNYSETHGGIPIVLFYQRVAEHVDAYLRKKGLRDQIDLYMGAYTRLHTKKMQGQPALQALLAYSENTGFVDGVDLHAHVSNPEQIGKLLKFVRGYTTKPLIVTEFTYVWGMKKGLEDDRLGKAFAGRWGYAPRMSTLDYLACEVYGVANGCAGQGPVSKAEWDDFMASRKWFVDHFILQADALFREHGVRGATFGLSQSEDGPSKRALILERPPWFLGFLFSPASIKPLPDGSPQTNYQYLDDFLEIQQRP